MSSRKSKVIALSIGQGLAKVIGLAVMMVMARMLVKEDVAAYQQTLLAYATLGPLLQLGISQGIYYFLPGEKLRIRGRVLDGIVVTGMMGFVFAIGLTLGGNEVLAQRFSNPKVANMLLWMIPYAIITTPARLVSSVLVVQDKVTLSAVFGVVQQFLIGASTIVPLVLWHTAESALVGNVVASLFMGVAAITLMIRATPKDSGSPTFPGVRELASFSIPLALAGMFGMISMQLDKLIVSFMCPPEEFSVYALGAIEIPLIGVVTGAITSIALADMRRSVVEGNKEEALRLFRRIAEKSSLVILPAMLFLLLTADTFIQYLYTDAYAGSAIPFRIYLIMLPIRTVVFGSLIIALGKSRFILFRSAVGLCINVILSALLVWKFGPWGAAAATVITVYLWAVPANLYLFQKEFQKNWLDVFPFGELGKTCLALIPLALVSMLVIATVKNIHVEFVSLLFCFAAFLAVYWKDRIYSADHIQRLWREK